nr:hypothetical protein [Tanacetum cinerariifolium]
MATTIEKQVAWDEALIPSTKRFKLDNKKHIVDMETFRDMLHICPRIPGQSFDELPYEADILEFLRFFEHSAQIRTLTDVNINKLFQLWRSFGVVINKCLTGKSFVFDSRNIDYAFLIWEDFVYQVEHKNHKKSNEMYYPTSLHVKGSVNPKTKQDEGTGSKPGVLDVPSDDSEEEISWNTSDDEETDTQEQ